MTATPSFHGSGPVAGARGRIEPGSSLPTAAGQGAASVRPALSKRHKYGATRVEVDGFWFASKAESRRYGQLKMLQMAGEIRELELQPEYLLTVNGVKIGKYRGDFRYFDTEGRRIIEDVKGARTPVYKLKKRLVEAIYPGVRIVEVQA